MEERVIFKMRYAARNESDTKMLNQKHLIYIATRPGTQFNPKSNFGCWGQLNAGDTISNVPDLRTARKRIGEASEGHTVYRAILSVNDETAREHNLYSRDEWERLLKSKVSIIRRQMNIREEDFRWIASMHYKEGHPHVHIMFWTDSPEPKAEFIPKERFEQMSENIRYAFSGAILHGDEITGLHKESDESKKQAKLLLQSMMADANLPDVLSLNRIKDETLNEIGGQLKELAITLPAKGSLKYDYLSAAYKAKLNDFLETLIADNPDFSKLSQEYTKINDEISRLYGNSEELSEEYRIAAHKKLLKELGNATLKQLAQVAQELRERELPEDEQALRSILVSDATTILKSDPDYQALLQALPTFRTPTSALLEDAEIRRYISVISSKLAGDLRLRTLSEGYFQQHRATGDADSIAAAKKAEAEILRRMMWHTVITQMREDAGYESQFQVALAMNCLLAIFRAGSQRKNQLGVQRDMRTKYRNLSETAKKDLRKQQQQAGGWDIER